MLLVALLAACGGGAATGPQAAEQASESAADAATDAAVPSDGYSESPMLAQQVAAGDLPPVGERLPSEPLVVTPVQMGQYGGPMRLLGLLEGAGVFTQLTESAQVGETS